LVFFESGLAGVCVEHARLYVLHRQLSWDQVAESDLKVTLAALTEDGFMLLDAQELWLNERAYYPPRDSVGVPPHLLQQFHTIYQWAVYYILAHEVAHHVLGHLSGDVSNLPVLNRIPAENRRWEDAGLTADQKLELQADALALLMAVGVTLEPYGEYPVWSDAMMAYFGSQIVFTALAELTGGYDRQSLSHPTLRVRAAQAEQLAMLWLSEESIRDLCLVSVRDYRDFLARLHTVHADYTPDNRSRVDSGNEHGFLDGRPRVTFFNSTMKR